MFNSVCTCDPNTKFRRGHESCPALTQRLHLSHAQRQQKWKMQLQLASAEMKLTAVDFLLNTDHVKEVEEYLTDIKFQLQQVYSQRQLAEVDSL